MVGVQKGGQEKLRSDFQNTRRVQSTAVKVVVVQMERVNDVTSNSRPTSTVGPSFTLRVHLRIFRLFGLCELYLSDLASTGLQMHIYQTLPGVFKNRSM